jgi:hypothetical protein
MLRSLHKRCTPRRKRAINQMRFQRLTRGSNLASNPGAPAVSLHKSSGSAPLPRPLVKGNASRRAGLAHADATQADPLPRLASRRRLSLTPAKPRRGRNRMRRRCDRQPERQRPGRSAPPRRRKSRPANARPSQNRGAGNICDADAAARVRVRSDVHAAHARPPPSRRWRSVYRIGSSAARAAVPRRDAA